MERTDLKTSVMGLWSRSKDLWSVVAVVSVGAALMDAVIIAVIIPVLYKTCG